VLSLAARAFDEHQHGKSTPVPTVAQFLDDELESRQKEKRGALAPRDTQRIMVQGTQLIAQLEDVEVSESRGDDADLVLGGPRPAAVSFRNEADGRSLTPKLRKLLQHVPRADGAKVVIVRDPRLPIAKTAVKAREYLKALQEKGVSLVEPSIEALAALDALASILGDAKSGDLANQSNALEAGAVMAWLKSLRRDLELEPVQELIDALLNAPPVVVDSAEQDLADLLSHEHVLTVEMAAQIIGQTPERVMAIGRKSSGHCLVLEGPPAVLLDVAGVAAEAEAAQ
jgi:hypothetical protein